MTEENTSRPIRVDAHHHFWPQPTRFAYPWMTDEQAALRRPFGPDDLRPLIETREIDWTVLVQTRSSLDETRDFLAIAERTDFVAGVVGWVDLAAPNVDRVLADLKAHASRPVARRHPPPGPRRGGPRLAAAAQTSSAGSGRSSRPASPTTCCCGRVSCRPRSGRRERSQTSAW